MQDNKLEKLKKVLDLLRDDTITPAQLVQFLGAMTDAVKQTKLALLESNTQTAKDLSNRLEQSLRGLENGQKQLKTAIRDEIAGHTEILSKQTKETLKTAIKALEEIKSIKVRDGYTPIKGRDYFDGEDGQDADPKKVVPLVMKELKEPLKKELKDLDGRIDRAISILDQRSQFLINKTIKVDGTTITGDGTISNPLVAVGGTGGGHTIQDEGTPLTQRTNLNFKGTGVQVVDNPIDNSSDVMIDIPQSGLQTFFFVDTASDIGGYKQAKNIINYVPTTQTNLLTNNCTGTQAGTPQILATFASNANFPGVTVLPTGVIGIRVRAKKGTSGGAKIYAQAFSRTTGGTETQIGTDSAFSGALTTTEDLYILNVFIGSDLNLNITDRIVLKILVEVTSSTPNVTISYDGSTNSRFELPIGAIDSSNFVPYTGATTDVDLGAHNILANKHAAFGNDALIDGVDPFGWGYASKSVLNITETASVDTDFGDTVITGIRDYLLADPVSNGKSVLGVDNVILTQYGNTKTISKIAGFTTYIEHGADGATNTVRGVDSYVGIYGGSSVQNVQGVIGVTEIGGSGSIDYATGLNFQLLHSGTSDITTLGAGISINMKHTGASGTINEWTGLKIFDFGGTSTGSETITNSYGINIGTLARSTMGNFYGLKIDNQAGAGNTYAIYTGVGKSSFGDVIELRGSTSGAVIVKPKAIAGAWTMTLPDSVGINGYVLSTDGSGGTSWISPAGGGDMILASVQSVTGLKTFDKDKLAMKGTSTGVTTISTANTSATSYTATLKAESGTIAYLSDITGSSGIVRSIVITSGSGTMGSAVSTDYVYLVAGAHTMTLPTAISNTNRYTVKNNHSANITVDTTSSQTIDGTTTVSISPQSSVDIISNNTNWNII